MSDQTIHNVTSLDWVVIDWIGENRTVSASAMTWLEWHEELLELRAERDALATELARLRRLEEAAIAYRTAYIEVEENEAETLQALFRAARDAEKARKQ
jgi:hypothetical protein